FLDGVAVVGGPAVREDLPVPVADDPARGRERDATDDVLPGDRLVVVGLEDLELEEAPAEEEEHQRHADRDPPEATSELARVGSLDDEAHRDPPSPGRGTV